MLKKTNLKNVFGNSFQLRTHAEDLLGLITSIYLSDNDRFTGDVVFTFLCGEQWDPNEKQCDLRLRKAESNLSKLLTGSYKYQSTHCMYLQYISHQTANDAVAFGSYFALCNQKVIYNLRAGFISLLSDSANAGLFFLYTTSMHKWSKIIERGKNCVNLIHQNCSCLSTCLSSCLSTHCSVLVHAGPSAGQMDVPWKYLWVCVHIWERCLVLRHFAVGNLLARYVACSVIASIQTVSSISDLWLCLSAEHRK